MSCVFCNFCRAGKCFFCIFEFNDLLGNIQINGAWWNGLFIKHYKISVYVISTLLLMPSYSCNLNFAFWQIFLMFLSLACPQSLLKVGQLGIFQFCFLLETGSEFGFNEFTLNHFKICLKSKSRLCNISPKNCKNCVIASKITYYRFWDKEKHILKSVKEKSN